ncbi:MAG: GAF domain-containing protein [Actinomycetota bacterium]|nr:GAF domain-containing protein [Actinomycetota bacterium]
MKSAKLLPLSHWIVFVVVGCYPLYSGERIIYWPWVVTVSGLAFLGTAYHITRRYLSSGGVGWWGLSLLGLDALFVSFLIYHSGGISSPFFPLVFLLAATASLYDHWTKALFLAGVMSAAYTVSCAWEGLQLESKGAHLLVNIVILLGSSVLLSYLAELDRREQSKAERIEALYKLSAELMESMNLEQTLHHLLATAASFFQTDISSIHILDGKSGTLRLQVSGTSRDQHEEQPDIAALDAFIGWVARKRLPILVNDSYKDDRFAPSPQAGNKAHSALAAPILVGGDLVGVLAFATTQPREFTSEDLQMVVTISNLAASVIARSDLYQLVMSRSEVIVSSMTSGLLVTDKSGRIIMANQASHDLLGLGSSPQGQVLRELLEPTLLDAESLWKQMEPGADTYGETGHANLEVRLRGRPERILSLRISPITAGYRPNSGSVVILEDITERVKVDEIRDDLMLLIARRVEEQTALYEVGRSLIDEVDTRNLLQFLLSKAVGLVDGEFGVLSFREEEEDVFLVKAVHGLVNDYVGHSFAPGDFPAGEAAIKGEPLRHMEIEPWKAGPWGVSLSGIISYLAAPITWQGRTTGIIEVASPSRHRVFGEDELRLLSLFVNQAAIALENSNLYRLITEDQRRTEAMLHSINDGVIAVNNEAQIILVNSAAERILNLPPFPSINGHHVKEVIRLPGLANIFLKSLNTRKELEEEIHSEPPEKKILEVDTSLIETSPGERIGIIAVIRDVTELRELEQAKSDFVSTVSHELRTPLTSIKAYTATLRRKDVEFDEGTRQEFLEIMEEETDRLTRLISDLLDVSRIESGRMELKKRDFDMVKLVRIATDRLQSHTSKHAMALNAPESISPVHADPDKIEQVIMNLVDNALKYSPEGGEVVVTLNVSPRKVEFSVSDQGVGIPNDHLPHIFDKFHRVDNRATREIYGTGLGLYVSKSIVEAHGGNIWAESTIGEGSVFYFNLPLAARQNHNDRVENSIG